MLSESQQQSIRDFLEGRYIPSGSGTEESACSIASINLALYGKLTDAIPDCMSRVIGKWIIMIQDSMPDEIRNSDRWRSLLPLAAGTGQNREIERLNLLREWMYEKVLPILQPFADANGFGVEWRQMCSIRSNEITAKAVIAARKVEKVIGAAWMVEAAKMAWFAGAKKVPWARASGEAWLAARETAWAATSAAVANEWKAPTTKEAARVARVARANFWNEIDPCEILEKMIKI